MEHLYYFANASLVLSVLDYLKGHARIPIRFMTVIYHIDGWIVRIQMSSPLGPVQSGNLVAVLKEYGIPYRPSLHVSQALKKLEAGEPTNQVMRSCQVAIVSHGQSTRGDIEAFRKSFIQGLGYCPEHLA